MPKRLSICPPGCYQLFHTTETPLSLHGASATLCVLTTTLLSAHLTSFWPTSLLLVTSGCLRMRRKPLSLRYVTTTLSPFIHFYENCILTQIYEPLATSRLPWTSCSPDSFLTNISLICLFGLRLLWLTREEYKYWTELFRTSEVVDA